MKTNTKGFTLIELLILIIIGGILLLSFCSCAAGPNPVANTANETGEIAGFWLGLWHGWISPFTFVISLFENDVQVYETHNNGNWYNFGFVIGAGILTGSTSSARQRRKD